MITYTWTLKTDDLAELNTHIRGPDYAACLHDITQELRSRSKYRVGEEQTCTWGEVYEVLWQILNDNNIDPFEEG